MPTVATPFANVNVCDAAPDVPGYLGAVPEGLLVRPLQVMVCEPVKPVSVTPESVAVTLVTERLEPALTDEDPRAMVNAGDNVVVDAVPATERHLLPTTAVTEYWYAVPNSRPESL